MKMKFALRRSSHHRPAWRIKALTRRTTFYWLTSGKASIHCCGFTVYDLRHLSSSSYINWRSAAGPNALV